MGPRLTSQSATHPVPSCAAEHSRTHFLKTAFGESGHSLVMPDRPSSVFAVPDGTLDLAIDTQQVLSQQ